MNDRPNQGWNQPPQPNYTQYQQEYPQYSSPYDSPQQQYSVPPPYDPREPQYAPPPQYAQPVYAQPVYAQPVEEPGSTSALLGFIFSLVGLFAFPVMLIPGLILSIPGMRSTSRHGLAVAGLVISIIGLVIWVVFFLIIIIAVVAAANSGSSYATPVGQP